MRLKILYYCDEYPPIKSGGIGTVTKIIAEEMSRRGHEVFVLSGVLPNIQLPEEKIENGVKIFRLRYFKRIAFLFSRKRPNGNTLAVRILQRLGILAIFAKKEFYRTHDIIKKIINENKIDIIEIPDYFKLSDYYKCRKEVSFPKYDIPSVARVHGSQSFASYFRDGKINDINKKNDLSLFNSTDRIIAVSRFSANFVNNVLGINRKIDVIYNPIDTERLLNNIEKKVGKNESKGKNVVFIGKIVETKGSFNLIKAFNSFARNHGEYHLVMIGSGDLEHAWSLTEEHTKDNVVFPGYISRKEICNYINNATFCCVPSFFENFSMVALEIMALGKALIYTKESSGPEIIQDGVNGLLVNPHSVRDIAEKMKILAENEKKRMLLGAEAKKTIERHFTIPVIASELESCYINIVNEKNANSN